MCRNDQTALNNLSRYPVSGDGIVSIFKEKQGIVPGFS